MLSSRYHMVYGMVCYGIYMVIQFHKIVYRIKKSYFEINMWFQRLNIASMAKKSRIRETPTLSTDADSRADTNLKRLRDLSLN